MNTKISNSVINKLAVLTLVVSLVYSPLISSFVNIGLIKQGSLVLYLMLCLVVFITSNNIKVDRTVFQFTTAAMLLMVSSIPFWDGFTTLGSYISVAIVFLLFTLNSNSFFEKLLKWTLFISVIIALGETLFGKYLYIVEVVVNGQQFVLDERLFSGSLDIFRAKGLFEGPLTFAQYCVFMSLLYFNTRFIIIIAFIGALTTSSRMAIFVIFSILLFQVMYTSITTGMVKNKIRSIVVSSVIFLTMITAFSVYLAMSSSDFTMRLLQTFDFSNSDSNKLRLYYWGMAISTFINYDIVNILIGNNGYYRGIFSNNAESGWLTLLVDNGLIGLFFYLIPCLYIFYKGFVKKKFEYMLFALVFILANSTMTFYLSASANVIYWYLIFKWLNDLKQVTLRDSYGSDQYKMSKGHQQSIVSQ